ncbi:MAG TPA: hypothetical protein VK186_13785 [Candidatus Deferrimicrobium sp.]|nr:hypothetical protein [Candidatus Deferrimicrobium sp.]
MEKALKVINDLLEQGIIKKYAIGGGIAAIFYMEPILTYDVDIFVVPAEENDGLLVLSSLYEYLKKKGYYPDKEHIVIEGFPVQFLPVFNELIDEAVNEAVEKKYKGINTKVMKVEYLIAIMLQTYRPKDKERVLKALNEAEIDRELLEKILEKFNLKKIFDKIYGGHDASW